VNPAILRATVTVSGKGTTFRVLRVDATDAGHLGDLLASHGVTASHDIEVRFAGDAVLNRMILPVRLLPKETTPVALQWTTLRTRPSIPAASYYVHLVDVHGTTAALDAAFLPPGSWRAGERVWTFGDLSDPGAPGTAMRQAEIGMYVLNGKAAAAGVTPLPMSDAQDNRLARLSLGPFVVRARASGPAARPPRPAAKPVDPLAKPDTVSAEERQRWLAEFADLDDDPALKKWLDPSSIEIDE